MNQKKAYGPEGDTSNVVDMSGMFAYCYSLTDFGPNWLDTSSADTERMYYDPGLGGGFDGSKTGKNSKMDLPGLRLGKQAGGTILP